MSFKSHEDIETLLKQLRENLDDVIDTHEKFKEDFYLLQWLKRHNYKLDRAEAMIRESLQWRKDNNIESLAHVDGLSTFPGLAHELPMDFDGISKGGQPVFTFNSHALNLDAIMKTYGKDMLTRYVFYMLERLEHMLIQQILRMKNKRAGNSKLCENTIIDTKVNSNSKSNTNSNSDEENIELDFSMDHGLGLIMIAGFKDFSVWNVKSKEVISALFEVARVGANYYPIFLRSGFILNMNAFFNVVFKLLKPIIASPSYTIKCFDTDKSKWLAALKDDVDEETLLKTFGYSKLTPV